MMAKVSALVVRSLRISSDLGSSISQKGFEGEHRLAASFRQYSQSSTSSWGTGEPPVDETPTERGVTSEQPAASGAATAEKPTDTEATTGEQKPQPKKSRTGGDLADDGQVDTPNLQKMRSTRDIIHNAGKEAEERLASDKKSPA